MPSASNRFLAFGNLNNGAGHGGLSCVNGNNNASNVNWNYAGRTTLEKSPPLINHNIMQSSLMAKIKVR